MQKLTIEQAVVISAYTGFMACPFSAMHAEIEKRLGRSVWTHEMPSIIDTEIRPAFKDDFISMCVANRSGAIKPRRKGRHDNRENANRRG